MPSREVGRARLSEWATTPTWKDRFRPLRDEKKGLSIRSAAARDRDRIVFSRSFRRLAHKTQVYLTSEKAENRNDHLRTRLTHSLEVAQIAKTIALQLNVNLELVEAIAFGHDVGHAPFGHAGEMQLDEFLNGKIPLPRIVLNMLDPEKTQRNVSKRDFGDFRHNFQSVRVLTFLERYEETEDGLNLTWQTLEGILKHTGTMSRSTGNRPIRYPESRDKLFTKLRVGGEVQRTVEAKIVELCDEIVQVTHDLNDAVELGTLEIDKLKDIKPVTNAAEEARKYYGKHLHTAIGQKEGVARSPLNTQLHSVLVDYFVRNTRDAIEKVLSVQKEKRLTAEMIAMLPKTPFPEEDFSGLFEFRDDLIINNYSVNRMDNKGKYIIRSLIEAYLCDPRQMPDPWLMRYMVLKRKELAAKKPEGIQKWFLTVEESFGIKQILSNEEKPSVISIIEKDSDGSALRKENAQLVVKLIPYLSLDADYIRIVADYIASMTDAYAENEARVLYL